MILKVGLTGGIASGKSTVARILAQCGAHVIDADEVVRSLYQPGRRGFEILKRYYGEQIITPEGNINRLRLADIAFKDPDAAATLNALIHPIVVEEEHKLIRAREESGVDEILVAEATLLLEAGGKGRYDRIVVVDVTPETQLERGVARGMEREEVERRMRRQISRQERLSEADYVVSTEGTLEETEQRARELYEQLERDLAAKIAAAK